MPRTSKAFKQALLTQVIVLTAIAAPGAALAGQGGYIGLEGGANFLRNQSLRIYSFDPTFGALEDGTKISELDFKTGYVGGLVLGYAFTSGFRLETEFARRHNKIKGIDLIDGTPSERHDGNENADIAFINLWFDLFPSAIVHPYIGFGAGGARVDIRNPGIDPVGLSGDDNNLTGDFDVVFAYQGGAGVRFDLGQHWTTSIDYRYLQSNKGKFNLLENNPNSHVETRYRSQAALLSVAYHFGSPPPPAPVAVEEPVQVVAVEEVPVEAPPPPPPPPPPCEPPLPGQAIDLQGCKIGDVVVLRGVNFMFDKSALTVNAKALLDGVADALTRRPDIKVEIQGHTDSKGSDSYNQRLSDQRASSARQYLMERGIDAGRMTAVGYGETMPVADNSTDEGRELNRRVALKVTERGPEAVAVAP